jgi:alpha,alpha-trehalase
MKRPPVLALALALLVRPVLAEPPLAPDLPSPARIDALRRYVSASWHALTRTVKDLPRAARDPKMRHAPGERWPVYVARTENLAGIERIVAGALDAQARRNIVLRTLPAEALGMTDHGLLYLPQPYVVPGGRFNEMYGWDSYFIERGLLRDGKVEKARQLVDDHLYEVARYGMVLNANRSYYLSRSQPPFLTRMILAVYERTHDRDWLRSTLPAVERTYALWTHEPHLVPATGLSRYWDFGSGPAPEVVSSERDAEGRTHYERVRDYFRTHAVTDYDVAQYYDRAHDALTPLFFKGDRSMRESGFDPSNLFGQFNVDVIHYVPVCLNSLLYQLERDAARIAELLGDRTTVATWNARAERRRARIDRYLWDEQAGLYYNYDFQTGKRRPYDFATTFYPLWVGLASPEQARRVTANLPRFEAACGLRTSTTTTGNQWDAPFGWAPLQLIAVEGLRRYGYREEADRLARKFVALVTDDFAQQGTIVEKYDVERCGSDVSGAIRFGYRSNEVGFGWTNGTVLELLASLGDG